MKTKGAKNQEEKIIVISGKTENRKFWGILLQRSENNLGLQRRKINFVSDSCQPETVFKKKNGAWNPMPELAITSPYVNYRVDSNTCIMGNPILDSPSTFPLCQNRLYPPVRTKNSASVTVSNGLQLAGQFYVETYYCVLYTTAAASSVQPLYCICKN